MDLMNMEKQFIILLAQYKSKFEKEKDNSNNLNSKLNNSKLYNEFYKEFAEKIVEISNSFTNVPEDKKVELVKNYTLQFNSLQQGF